MTIIQHPRQFKIPNWMLNRQKDIRDGKYTQVIANNLDTKLRDDIERLKKIRAHRGLRHYWGLRVRGQHSKTTGKKSSAYFHSSPKTLSNMLSLQVARDELSVSARRREEANFNAVSRPLCKAVNKTSKSNHVVFVVFLSYRSLCYVRRQHNLLCFLQAATS